MGIQVGDNFDHKSKKPLDARTSYGTLALMKAVTDANIYEGCLAYCAETDTYYKFLSTNTVDEDTGKWREYESGGGTEYTAGDGIVIDNDEISIDEMPSEDMVEVIPSLPVGRPKIVAGFTPIGTIIPLMGNHAPTHYLICNGQVVNISEYPELANYFEREFGTKNHFGGNGTTTFAVPNLNGEFLRGTGSNSHSGNGNGAAVGVHQDATTVPYNYAFVANGGTQASLGMELRSVASSSIGAGYQYADSEIKNEKGYITTANSNIATRTTATSDITTRPTNTSVLFCIATKDIYMDARNDYSTDEKVVGKWIDGKPIYQKTVLCTYPTEIEDGVNTSSNTEHGVANIDSRILCVINDGSDTRIWRGGATSSAMLYYTEALLTNTYIQIDTDRPSFAGRTAYVTIQYTKQSD